MGVEQTTLRLIIETVKRGGGDKDVVRNLRTLGVSLAAVTGAMVAAKKAYDDTVGALVDYNKQIKDASEATGTSAEDFSRIVQVADDMGISMESVTRALQMATKNGFAPSVNSLAELADRANAMTDPTERAAMLAKIMGRNWAEIDPVLQLGSQRIKELAGAVEDGLVVTDEEIGKTERVRLAQDKLNDSVTNLRNNVSLYAVEHGNLVQQIENMSAALTGSINIWEAAANSVAIWFRTNNEAALIAQEHVYQIHAVRDALEGVPGAADAAGDAMADLTVEEALAKAFEAELAGDTAMAAHYKAIAQNAYEAARAVKNYIEAEKKRMELIAGSAGVAKLRLLGQHGLDFTVPPGFPNDSFSIGVQSGERVVVQPSHQKTSQGGGGGGVNIGTLNVNTGQDERQLLRMLERYA
jgi:hypothetical protein